MEIEDLHYEKRPLNTNKLYEIFSLSSNGFNQYINHDSYTHKFLEKKAPKLSKNKQHPNEGVFYSTSKPNFYSGKKLLNDGEADSLVLNNDNETSNEIYQPQENNNEASEGSNINNNKNIDINEQQQEEDNKNKSKALDLQIEEKTLDKINHYNSRENNYYHFAKSNSEIYNNHNMKNINKIMLPKSKISVIHNNLRDNKNNFKKFTVNLLESDYSYHNLDRTTKFVQKIPSERNLSISTQKSFYFQKSNLDPLSRRLNMTSSNFRETVNKDSDSTSNSRFDPNHLKNLNLFIKSKSYFNMDKIIEADTYCRKRYQGFQSFNVPHVDNLIKDNFVYNKKKKPISLLTEKIAQSCIGNKKISFDLTQSPKKMEEVQEENEKLKNIIMIQTNSDFLKKSKLPEIQYCISQPKLKIRKNDLVGGKIKHLGDKYNPYNFQAGRDCETNRRNQTGALFQH